MPEDPYWPTPDAILAMAMGGRNALIRGCAIADILAYDLARTGKVLVPPGLILAIQR